LVLDCVLKSVPPGGHLDTVVVLAVYAASNGGGAQHRTGGSGRGAAMASSICWNNPRKTATSAVQDVIKELGIDLHIIRKAT
jgi:hypothetical protein